MKINLFTSFYNDKNAERDAELKFCLHKNVEAGFDTINLLTETGESMGKDGIISRLEIQYVINKVDSIPTFNQWFEVMCKYEYHNDINILSNSDVFFTKETLKQIKDFFKNCEQRQNTCLALSRWDFSPGNEPVLFERSDSQDCWCFFGSPNIKTAIDFRPGEGGCDNRIAYELQQSGYQVTNPSKSIKTYHYHDSNVRSWIDANGNRLKETVPPPYLLVPPIF